MPTTTSAHPEFDFSDIKIIDRDGQRWITAAELNTALGYKDNKAVLRVLKRCKDEFTPSMKGVVNLTTPGGTQKTVVLSFEGARLVTLLSRTPRGKAFRRWVLDLIERERRPNNAIATRDADRYAAVDMTAKAVQIAHDMNVLSTALSGLYAVSENERTRGHIMEEIGLRVVAMNEELGRMRVRLCPDLATPGGKAFLDGQNYKHRTYGPPELDGG